MNNPIQNNKKIYELSGITFTYVEMECVDGFLRDKKIPEIAAALRLSTEAVEEHLKQIKKRLNASNDDEFSDRLIDLGCMTSSFRSKIWGYQPRIIDENRIILEFR